MRIGTYVTKQQNGSRWPRETRGDLPYLNRVIHHWKRLRNFLASSWCRTVNRDRRRRGQGPRIIVMKYVLTSLGLWVCVCAREKQTYREREREIVCLRVCESLVLPIMHLNNTWLSYKCLFIIGFTNFNSTTFYTG